MNACRKTSSLGPSKDINPQLAASRSVILIAFKELIFTNNSGSIKTSFFSRSVQWPRLFREISEGDFSMIASHVARDRSRELSVSRSACASRWLSCQKSKHIEETKNFWETLRLLCSGVEEDLPNVSRPRLPLWGSEVGFGAWSSEKGLRGTGKVKSSDNDEQCEEKESNHVELRGPFWSFSPPSPRGPPSPPSPSPAIPPCIRQWGVSGTDPPMFLSSRCLSFSASSPISVHTFLFRFLVLSVSLSRYFFLKGKRLRRERGSVSGQCREQATRKSSRNGEGRFAVLPL